jgi:hypothetical protein
MRRDEFWTEREIPASRAHSQRHARRPPVELAIESNELGQARGGGGSSLCGVIERQVAVMTAQLSLLDNHTGTSRYEGN